MRMYDIIEKKRNGHALSREEIEFFVNGYTNGDIPDYQASALLMAIFFNQMNYNETLNLTLAMKNSGDVLDLTEIPGIKADKHSTGGVGDKTTLVLAPMVASLGVKTAKMSGRGLGHTGGTIDKLESFTGFSTSLDKETFVSNVNRIGLAITGQTGNITPADKKIYALRDVTATVDNVSLIASSIMSKKLAAGSDVIVLDVKAGSGAFMKNTTKARELANVLVKIGRGAKKKTYAVISDMNQPLGRAVGNSLEVVEAVNLLKGKGEDDLLELCLELGSLMVVGAGITKDTKKAKELLKKQIESGKAFEKFKEFVVSQGGVESEVDNPEQLINVKQIIEVKSDISGFVKKIDCEAVGISVMMLGGGRQKKGDTIDKNVGLIINKKIGDKVKIGDSLCTLYVNDDKYLDEVINKIKNAYTFSKTEIKNVKLIKDIIV